MTLRLNGDSSGFTEIKAPNAAGDNSITLPTSNGGANQLLQNGGTAGSLQYTSAAGGVVYDSSGRLLVNTASVGTDNFSTESPLQVQAGAGAYALAIRNRAPENDYGFISFGSTDGNEQLANIFCERTAANTANLYFATNGGNASTNSRIAINSDGTLRLINTPGIDFSDISTGTGNGQGSDTTPNNNLLDDYEEGTFDAEIAITGSGATYSHHNSIFYVKIGKTVSISGRLLITRTGTATGGVLQFKLPFAADSSLGNSSGAPWMSHGMCMAHDINFPSDAAGAPFFWEINNTTHAGWFCQRNNQSWQSADPNLIKTSPASYLTFSMVYRAA